jgi:mRNA interferase RelE/StbE
VYQVRLRSKKVRKQLDDIPSSHFHLVDAKLMVLRENPRPRGYRKLIDNIYRVRAGVYRIIYHIDDTRRLVEVGKIARRTERTYRNIEELFR